MPGTLVRPPHRVEHIGQERQPVIVLDNFCPAPAALRAHAERLAYRPMGPHYPGLRAAVDAETCAALLAPVQGLIGEVFGVNIPVAVVFAAFSLVTYPSEALTPIQRLPHFDGLEAERLALLLYLGDAAQGGTAFYSHRSTGFETIDASRHAAYGRALRADIARHGLPAADYIRGSTAIYEQIARFAAAPNRALIYRGHSLHCADLPADLELSPDPRRARLTVNLFLLGAA